MKKIKVLIVEDSKLMQQVLSSMLSSDPDIRVVGTVADPLLARDIIKKTSPDVITLDIMLPYMDGITFLKNLMRLHPLPVVMISALTEKGSAIALEALALGAVDYLPKPTKKDLADLSKYEKVLINTIKTASDANVGKNVVPITTQERFDSLVYQSEFLKKEVIGIGASTGGIEAIENIIMRLPPVLPPVLIVQHIKKEFSRAFARRITKLYGIPVVEPENYTELLPGHIYMAAGDYHMTVKKQKLRYIVALKDTPPMSGHKPSIDMLFHSMANAAGAGGIGILLTGMGTDGAKGLKEIHNAGGTTIIQDKETSVVWGMPGAAVKLNAVDYILPIDKISQKILQIIDAKALLNEHVR